MKRKGLIFLAAVVLMAGVNLVRAQDAVSSEKTALIKELVEVTNGKQNFNDIISNMLVFQRQQSKDMVNQMVGDASGTYADKTKIAEIVDEAVGRITARTQKFFDEKFDFDKFINEVYIPIYAKHFTDSELRDMIAFYRTPTGQKTMKELPALMQDTMVAISGSLLPPLMEFLKQAVDDEKTALLKRLPKKKSSGRRQTAN